MEVYMLKNKNVEKYAAEMKNLIEKAKRNGVDIHPYEKKIEKDDSELVVERGIAVYTCDIDIKSIPTWKLAE